VAKCVPDDWQGLARIRQLPAHQHHERKPKEKENQPGDPVLNPNNLVIGRDDVLPPERKFVVVVPGIVMMRIVFGVRVRSEARRSVHMRESETEYQGKVFKRKAPF
jgi:hypothetical protein